VTERPAKIWNILALVLAVACGVPANAGSDALPASDTISSDRPAADSAFLALEGGGLRVFLASTGSSRPLPFGTPSTEVLAVLTTVLGSKPAERGENVDCAAKYAVWDNGLTVWFTNDRFSGWHVGRGSSLTTSDGLGPGTTRAQLEAARNAVFTSSSLGEEFTIGELAGLLESAAPDASVQHLWSGHVCIAR